MERAESFRTRSRPNSVETARSGRALLFVSLILNLGLLLFLAWVCGTSAPTNNTPTTAASERIRTKDFKRVALKTRASAWQQLESTDLAVYAANLRTAGCPVETVRDILLPLLEEKFEYSEPSVSEPTNFWASFSQRQAAAVAGGERENALTQAKDKTLKELFGFAWNSEGLKESYAGEAASSVGFLDFERAGKLLCIDDRFKKRFAQADRSHRIDHRSVIYQAWREQVSEILSPNELEETELREILAIFQRHNPNLCKAGLSGSELRQLMVFRRELCNPLPLTLFVADDDFLQEPVAIGEKQFQSKARSLLGDNRFIDYLKSSDLSVERTLAALEREQLPRSLALQLFDLRHEAMDRAQAIRQLPVHRAEKRAQLAALHQNALEQLAVLPNAATDINRDWLQEIANP